MDVATDIYLHSSINRLFDFSRLFYFSRLFDFSFQFTSHNVNKRLIQGTPGIVWHFEDFNAASCYDPPPEKWIVQVTIACFWLEQQDLSVVRNRPVRCLRLVVDNPKL